MDASPSRDRELQFAVSQTCHTTILRSVEKRARLIAWENGGVLIVGKTAIGRATATLLSLNDSYHQMARSVWIVAGCTRLRRFDGNNGLKRATSGFTPFGAVSRQRFQWAISTALGGQLLIAHCFSQTAAHGADVGTGG